MIDVQNAVLSECRSDYFKILSSLTAEDRVYILIYSALINFQCILYILKFLYLFLLKSIIITIDIVLLYFIVNNIHIQLQLKGRNYYTCMLRTVLYIYKNT